MWLLYKASLYWISKYRCWNPSHRGPQRPILTAGKSPRAMKIYRNHMTLITCWLAEGINQRYKFNLINILFLRKKLFHCPSLLLSPTCGHIYAHTLCQRTRRWWEKVRHKLRTMQARGGSVPLSAHICLLSGISIAKEISWGSWIWQQFLTWAGIKVSDLRGRVVQARVLFAPSSYPWGKIP